MRLPAAAALLPERAADRFCRRISQAYLLFLLTLFPLFTGLGGYLYLDWKKYSLFGLVTGLWLLLLAVRGVILLARGARPGRPKLFTLFLALFLLSALASTLLSPYGSFLSVRYERYEGMLSWFFYCAILLGAARFGRAGLPMLAAFTGAYCLCCLTALLQLCGLDPLGLYPPGMNYYSPVVQETGRFLGPLGNIDIFSACHCLAVPLFLSLLLLRRERLRFLLLPALLLGLLCQVWAGVASGLLALALTLLLVFPYLLVRRYEEARGKRLPRLLLFSGVFLLLLGILAVYAAPVPASAGTLHELHCVLHGELREEFGSHRIQIWREVWRVFRRWPWAGIGPDSLEHYLSIRFERYSEALGELLTVYVTNAHNEYLQFLVSFGIRGCLPAAAAGAAALAGVLRERRPSLLRRCLFPGLFCYMIQAFFNIGSFMVAPLFFLGCGLALAPAPEAEGPGARAGGPASPPV